MAKVNDYKQSMVYTVKKDGSVKQNDDLIHGVDTYFKRNDRSELYVEFVLKRRQSVETWIAQIRKAIMSRLHNINDARKSGGFEPFTAEALESSLKFTYEQDADKVRLVIWSNE